jgi:acetyl coenzyme A synthetase (ADP forming)-like protein
VRFRPHGATCALSEGMHTTAPVFDYSADVVLRDGSTVHLRPIRLDDDVRLLDLLHRMSAEALYYRFLSVPRIDHDKAMQLVRVDPDHQRVLVAECAGRIVATAGYYTTEHAADCAEVAFAVADAWRGRGVGTRLLECLAEIGRRAGIRVFDAYVLGENRRMMDVFLESGFAVTRELDHGVFHVSLQLETSPRFTERAAGRSQQAAAASMRPFFEPNVVAVIGANRTRGRIGSEILHNLIASGFTGKLVPVHPDAQVVEGLAARARVCDIEDPVDLAIIAVPAAKVAAAVDDCIAKGVKALVVISAGFGETGGAGTALEAELVEKIRAAGIRMVGPNCMGIINTDPGVRLNATFSPVYPPAGRVAFSTQSGALGLAILDYVARRNLGMSTFASIGNKADVSSNDLIQYWANDARTDVILLYLESFGNPRKFAQIARRVGRQKPIVAVKAGRSAAGARAASSHTGARATSDALTDTLLRQSGVIRTHTLEEMFDVAALLANQPVPQGAHVAIVTNAGGPGILAADACEANGLEVSSLSPHTAAALRSFLPAAASVANPVDMIASASAEDYRRTIELVLADPHVDSLLAIFIPPIVTAAEDVASAIQAASAGSTKPVLATFMGVQGTLPSSKIPTFTFPESAAVALARVTQYGEWRRKPSAEPPHLSGFNRDAARALVTASIERGGGWLDPVTAEQLLAAAGIKVAEARIARRAEEAERIAGEVGLPVALKGLGSSLLHKTEAGAVKLRLTDGPAVRAAFTDLEVRLGDRLDGVLVQRMIGGAVEMVVGGLNDPALGPVIMAGTGGIFVDLLGDTAFRMCPLTEGDAADMIEELKGRLLLRGYRGAPPADEAAFRVLLLSVSQLLDACPEIEEMDLNPVMVLWKGAVAVDVRIKIGQPRIGVGSRRISY